MGINYDDFECPTPEDDTVSSYVAFSLAGCLTLFVPILHYGLSRSNPSKRAQTMFTSLTWGSILFSVNLTILGIFQYSTNDTLKGMFIVGLLFFLARIINASCFGATHWLEGPLRVFTGLDHLVERPNTIMALDKYCDFSVDMVSIAFLGGTQLVLVSMYVFAVYEAGRPCFEDLRIYTYYILGIVAQVGYTRAKFYLIRYHQTYHYWRVMLTLPRDGEGFVPYLEEGELQRVHSVELWIRFLFSLLINEIGMLSVFALLPIQLAASLDPMNFVMNCVAAYFIVELDDTDEKEFGLFQTLPADTPSKGDAPDTIEEEPPLPKYGSMS
eukprot:Nitzschia sp. Nitz4//scaffold245_size28976//25658//26719//NITZ4_008077-RA/size28976-snap-gene-0.2-mRNA-1//1//CDS//3329543896//1439//frame0